MTKQSSFGDSQVTSIGRWTPLRVTLATSHVWCSIHVWRSFSQIQKTALCASGICNAVFKLLKNARIPTATGSWIVTRLLTISQQAMTMEWMFSSLRGNAMHPIVLVALSSSSNRSNFTCTTWQASKSQYWLQFRQAGNKFSWISQFIFTIIHSIRLDTTYYWTSTLKVANFFLCLLIKTWIKQGVQMKSAVTHH